MLDPQLETVILFAGEGKNVISSSTVREIASFGGDFSAFVPKQVYKDIIENIQGGQQNGK